jgi:DNA-binding MarR family transcriptional regulator
MSEKRISFLLNALVKEMNGQADTILRSAFSLTYSQFVFLQALAEGGQLDVTRLAESLGVTKAAVSKRLDWFAERELIVINQDPDNAKAVLVSLSRQGLTLARDSGDFLEREFMTALSATRGVDFSRLSSDILSITSHLQRKS